MPFGIEDADRNAYYEGFDNIFSQVPHFKRYQFWLLGFAGWTCVIGGQTQTASVILQARPEQYRCKNQLDEQFGAKFDEHAFASTNTKCRKWNFDWESSCPNATSAGDYQSCESIMRSNEVDLTCSKCEDYVYASNNTFTQTVISEFHWLCDDSAIPINSITTSIFMTGLFFGALGFGNLSDSIGRRQTMLISVTSAMILNFILYFVNHPTVYIVLRFLAGAAAHGSVIVSYVYLMEFIGPKSRAWVGAHFLCIFSLGYGSLSIIGYYVRDWHWMQVLLAVSCLPFFLLYFLSYCSPPSHRWLYAKGRRKEGRKELKLFAKRCGADLTDDYIDKIEGMTQQMKGMKHYTSFDLMKWPKMRLISLNSGYCWFVTSMVYYGLGLNAGSLAGNIFLNNAINASMEILARMTIPYMMESKLFGRRRSLVLCFFVLCVSCVTAMLCKIHSGCMPPPNHSCEMTEVVLECNQVMLEISKIMAFVGKFAVAACFSILYTFSAELYPTCVRSSAVGFCSSCARVGGALSPLIFGLDHEYAWFSNTVFGVLSLLAMITSIFLPETLGMPMSQTMKEAENNYYKSPRDILEKTDLKASTVKLNLSSSDEEKDLLSSSLL